MAKDMDVQIAKAIATTRSELESARAVVRDLANELADVIDVVEPALLDHSARIRRARMSTLDELRQITIGFREVRETLLSESSERMLVQAERFLRVFRELEEFRMAGALDAYVSAFCSHVTQGDHYGDSD